MVNVMSKDKFLLFDDVMLSVCLAFATISLIFVGLGFLDLGLLYYLSNSTRLGKVVNVLTYFCSSCAATQART